MLFVADKMRHMHIEESNLNTALWAHYSDSELMEINASIVLSLSPGELALITYWLTPAVTPLELASFLNCMQVKLSAQSFTDMVEQVRVRCNAVSWSKAQGLMTP